MWILINELLGRVFVLHILHKSPALLKISQVGFNWENPIIVRGLHQARWEKLEFPVFSSYSLANHDTKDPIVIQIRLIARSALSGYINRISPTES